MKSRKRAISELIAYVLLISLAITMAGIVGAWLRFYVQPSKIKACPEGISIIIADYSCDSANINITVQNKGLFNISGFIIRVSNETIFMDQLSFVSFGLAPNALYSGSFNKTKYGKITEIQILPFRKQDGETVYCGKAVISQKTTPDSGCLS